MDTNFWKARWKNRQTGFHLDKIHPQLQRYFSQCFSVAPVFIPLCGKALDIYYLNKEMRCPVVGVEVAEQALLEFGEEQQIELSKTRHNNFSLFHSGDLKLYCGDIFEMSGNEVASVHQVYDRAALIALPEAMRKRYVEHLLSILPRPISLMLITLEYPQEEMTGPPFSVAQNEVLKLFSSASKIERLHYKSIIDKEPRFKSKGLSDLYECVYHIKFESKQS